ncbi:MAG TPA: hypothetical protein VIH93_01145 [Thermoanaerobaculia bacterium]|jgi:hypothetical protein
MSTKRFKEKLVDWKVLHDNLAPRLTDLPQFAADHTALGQVLAQAQDLENKQELARAAFRQVNSQRKEISKQGGKLQTRLALGLRGVMNPENSDLTEFRIKPRAVTSERRRLTPLERAEREAARAAARLAQVKAAEKPPPPPPASPTPATQ